MGIRIEKAIAEGPGSLLKDFPRELQGLKFMETTEAYAAAEESV